MLGGGVEAPWPAGLLGGGVELVVVVVVVDVVEVLDPGEVEVEVVDVVVVVEGGGGVGVVDGGVEAPVLPVAPAASAPPENGPPRPAAVIPPPARADMSARNHHRRELVTDGMRGVRSSWGSSHGPGRRSGPVSGCARRRSYRQPISNV